MNNVKKISLVILVLFYMVAGFNHFISPESYFKIIPHYLPWPHALNFLAGFFELLFGAALILGRLRAYAAWGIILMLVAFLPVHIAMIGDAPFKLGSVTVTSLIAWVRLLVFQPLLILWAWWYTRPVVNN